MTNAGQTQASADTPPALLRVERLIIVASLVLIIALAWVYLASFDMAAGGSGDMAGMEAMDDMAMAPLSFGLLAAMWIVMMIGMMLPSAAPMILMAARIGKAKAEGGGPAFATAMFVLGYGLAWTGFSLIAAAAQVGLQEGMLSGDWAIRHGSIAGGVLLAAGFYQWTPLKRVCLAKCRSPVGFFFSHWRPGALGALGMGARHGLFCLGCCWLLMALLFVAGVMALPWVAALAGLVLLEKLAPRGEWIARLGGVAMIGAGIYIIIAG